MRPIYAALLLTCLTACAGAPDAVKPAPYTYVSPPEPRGDDAGKADSSYIPATRDPTATPYPQW